MGHKIPHFSVSHLHINNVYPIHIHSFNQQNRRTGSAVYFCWTSWNWKTKMYFVELESSTVHRTPNQFWNTCLAVSGSKLYLFVLMLSLFVHKHNMRKIYNFFFSPLQSGQVTTPRKYKEIEFQTQLPWQFLTKSKRNFVLYKRYRSKLRYEALPYLYLEFSLNNENIWKGVKQ